MDNAQRGVENPPLAFVRKSLSSILCHLLQTFAPHAILFPMDPSAALATRLAADESDLALALSASSPGSPGPPPSTLSEARALADRLLISATPVSIRTLRRIAESGDDKAAVSAASKILDKSPATRDLGSVGASGLTLPPEAFASLISSLASLASAALTSASAPSPAPASAPSAAFDRQDPIDVTVLPDPGDPS